MPCMMVMRYNTFIGCAVTGLTTINRGLIQAILASLPPQPIGEVTKASNLQRIPPGVWKRISIKRTKKQSKNKQNKARNAKMEKTNVNRSQNYPIWEAIQNRNGPVSITTDTSGQLRDVGCHQSIFGGNDDQEDEKYILKQKFEGFSVSIQKVHKGYEGVDSLSFDDLYNNLRVFESDVKGSTTSSSSPKNVAFVSENTSKGLVENYQFDSKEQLALIKQKVACTLSQEGHFARECRIKGNQDNRRRDAWNSGTKDGSRTGQKEDSKALVIIDGEGVDWTNHSEDEDYALMACNSSDSDTEFGVSDTFLRGDAFTEGLKDLESHLRKKSLMFWRMLSPIINNVRHITAKVAGKSVSISEASIRSDLLFDDADGIDTLPNQDIFDAIQQMGYEGDLTVLTFNKALFSPQWRFLFHTINHCLSSKSTSWDQIPTNIATAVICLTTNQKYNFSKLIFDGMLRHLDAKKKFVMYPRFISIFLGKQLVDVSVPLDHFPVNTLTSKVFSFMVKKGKHFSGKVTPLFANMLVQPTQDEGASSERPSEVLPTPSPAPTSDVPLESQLDSSPAQTSEVPIEHQPNPSPRPSPTNTIPASILEPSGENLGGHSSSDRSLSGNEGDMTIQGVYDLCLSLCKQVSDQAKEIQGLKAQITKLKKQAKPVIKHHQAYLKSVSLKQRFPRKSFSKKHRVHKESVSKQGRKIAKGESSVQRDPLFDVMPEETIDHMETENAQDEGRTREIVDEDKEIDEGRLSTEDEVSTVKEGVSTDLEKVSTDRPIVSTDESKVSTDMQFEGTDEQVKGTEEHNEGTEDKNEGTEEIFESTEEQKEGTEEKVESTDGQIKGTEDQTEEEIATQATQTKERSPPHNLGRNRVNTYAVRITMLIADIEDDIMDPVMQCTTLPSHSGFSQKKLVSFVTEIHTTSIDFLTPSYSQAVNKSPTHYPCDSARTFRVILFSIHNDEWKSFQCHHQTALRSYALSWKPCQGDSLNLPDHRIHKDGDGDASFQLKSDSLPHAHA
ncbi:hypothetical protein Tco_1054914 [Tanacetum coccineum]|uniref:Uncharacterized protein n=1 Tax=Tanacetum coccineum TaxID=301880 RepID=A0ABQ5H070_9ASTR